jgi:shikimate kinase
MSRPDGPPNLYLVGFMATGKSTFGRMIANRLGMQFIDVDSAIEHQAGMPVTEIFQTFGEAHFRQLERKFIESGHPARGCVVACGGGLVCQPGMLELLREKGVIICLSASEETILARTANRNDRPLLNTENPADRIRRLLAERTPIYQRAGTMVLTENRPFNDVAEHLVRVYRREARDFDKSHA